MINSEFNKMMGKYNKISELANKLVFKEKPIILCLGNEKIIADSLGPLVGYFLINKYNLNTSIYGTLGRNVTNFNIDLYYKYIKKYHKNTPILVIDSSIDAIQYLGNIKIEENNLISKCKRKFKNIGDITIKGVVLPNSLHCKFLLRQTKLSFVYNLANQIAKLVNDTYKLLY